MKKYKLLKDLPGFDAGTICSIEPIIGGGKAAFLLHKDCEIVMASYDVEKLFNKNRFDEWFEEIEDKPWKPNDGEQYHYIDTACADSFTDFLTIYHDDVEHYGRIDTGNYFKTSEEARLARRKLKALKRLKDKGLAFENWKYIDDIDDDGKAEIRIRAVLNYSTIHDHAVREDLNLLFEEVE